MSVLAEKLITETAAKAHSGADDHQSIHDWGRQRLMQHGFPDLKTEEWKYTPLRVLEKREFQDQPGTATTLPSWPVEGVVLHFDHGILSIDPATLPEGVKLTPVPPEALKKKDYDQIYGQREGAFAWLNLAQFQQAWHLEITGEQTVIIATTTSGAFEAQVHPRMVIEIASNASLNLIEYQRDLGQGLINGTCEINLAEGAKVEHLICRQNAESVWIQRTDVDVAKDADYRVVAFDQGGRLTRHDLKVHVKGSGANGEIDGLVLLNGRQHVDWHTEIAHCVGQTNSREAFRFLADGSSVGVLNGRIHIHADSDDSHS
ncbi:MAG TPA: SufD family Fe-S cluster assembly protein, partial [Wenzhouxiangella sp.]